jgi:parvulin-like peptidyl-prolyl isomerase
MKKIWKLSFAGSGLIVALSLIGCGGPSGSSGALATVNGDNISMQELVEYIQRKPTVIVDTQSGPQLARVTSGQSLGFQAMRDLIVDKIVEQIAKEQGVYPKDSDVAAELDFQQKVADLRPQRLNIAKEALAAGYSTESFKHQLLVDLCRMRIMTKGITVTPQEVEDYIKTNPDNELFTDPPRIKALMILVPRSDEAKKKKVDDALKQGQPFLTVANEYSIDPQARAATWHYHVDNVNQMPPQVRALLEKTAVGASTDWVAANEGFVKFSVEQKTPAKPKDTKDPTVREIVRRSLAAQKGQATIDINGMIQAKLKNAGEKGIVIVPHNYQDTWKRVMDQMLAAPAQPSAQPGASPQPPVPGTPVPPDASKGGKASAPAPGGSGTTTTTGAAAPSGAATGGAAPGGAAPGGAPQGKG